MLQAGLELMQRELDRLTDASEKRPLTTQEVTRLSKILRTMSDLAGSPAPPPSPDEPQSQAQPPRNSGVLERMLADMHQRP